jgi:hypothetical protein
MTELEQLRKEVNELRGRVAQLEAHNGRTAWGDLMNMQVGGNEPNPRFTSRDPAPQNVTCFPTTER